jgi:hypothetical protein
MLHRGRRRQGKTGGAFVFALNFLLLLFFQEKESNNASIRKAKFSQRHLRMQIEQKKGLGELH